VDLRNDIICPIDCDEKDYVRWKNCLQRDFTINGLVVEDTNYHFLVSEYWISILQLSSFFKCFDVYVFLLFYIFFSGTVVLTCICLCMQVDV
jgi:hypothetical protein